MCSSASTHVHEHALKKNTNTQVVFLTRRLRIWPSSPSVLETLVSVIYTVCERGAAGCALLQSTTREVEVARNELVLMSC